MSDCSSITGKTYTSSDVCTAPSQRFFTWRKYGLDAIIIGLEVIIQHLLYSEFFFPPVHVC